MLCVDEWGCPASVGVVRVGHQRLQEAGGLRCFLPGRSTRHLAGQAHQRNLVHRHAVVVACNAKVIRNGLFPLVQQTAI